MYTTDVSPLDIEQLFYDIKIKAIKKLEIDFMQKNLDIAEIKNLNKQIEKIEKNKNQEEKLKMVTSFLIDNGRYYKEGVRTPLNLFFQNCTLIIRKHFQ